MKHDHAQFDLQSAYRPRELVEDRVRRFTPMVRRAAWHVHGMASDGIEVDDLLQAGMVALTECARRHDGPGEDGFAAYAKMRVRGAMIDQLRKAMPLSRTAARRRRAYEEAVDALHAQLGRAPAAGEIAGRLGCSLDQLREIEASQPRLSSIEESYDEHDAAFADDAPDPFETLSALEDRERLVEALAHLPQRLQLVLQLYFAEEMNLTEIAQVLEVSVPRVHQLRAQALARLRAIFVDAGEGETDE